MEIASESDEVGYIVLNGRPELERPRDVEPRALRVPDKADGARGRLRCLWIFCSGKVDFYELVSAHEVGNSIGDVFRRNLGIAERAAGERDPAVDVSPGQLRNSTPRSFAVAHQHTSNPGLL